MPERVPVRVIMEEVSSKVASSLPSTSKRLPRGVGEEGRLEEDVVLEEGGAAVLYFLLDGVVCLELEEEDEVFRLDPDCDIGEV